MNKEELYAKLRELAFKLWQSHIIEVYEELLELAEEVRKSDDNKTA